MQPEKEVYSKLDMVYDPELDQPLTELNFIDEVITDGSNVTIFFRLPTYWCSPNFAFMMAEDIRDRVSELPWVTHVNVHLKDHHASEDINHGVSNGRSFTETFPGVSSGELEELRAKFREKSFLARQERLLRHLIQLGFNQLTLLETTIRELEERIHLLGNDTMSLWQKYLSIRSDMNHCNEPDQLAFIQPNGKKIEVMELKDYLSNARWIRMNMEFNTHHCRGLFDARYTNRR